MNVTGACEVGRTPRSRWLVALMAGLLAGYGVVSPGQMVAEARIAESIATTDAWSGGAATIVMPGEFRNSAVETQPQTDTETLDEGAPPVASSPPSSGDDAETLDQGSPPPAGGVESVVPVGSVAGTYVAPAPTTTSAPSYAAPAESTSAGPSIPPGFGTGHVHVAAGLPEFPVGLVSCHVGTITGRAYVGVDCPNGDSVVGFAPSLNDFPFILNPDFPFEGDEGFLIDAARSDAAASDAAKNNVDVLASMPGPQQDDSTSQTQIGVSGTGSVQYAQKTHTTEPTVETNAGQSGGERTKSSKQDSSGSSSTRMQHASQGKDGGSNRTYSLAKRQKAQGHERHQQHQGSANGKSRHGDNGGHNKQSHGQKNKDNQKAKDNHKSKSNQKDKSGGKN